MIKVKVDLDWLAYDNPFGAGLVWRCKALGCVFTAFPAPDAEGWRLGCSNTSIPGAIRAVDEDGNLLPTFENIPLWATKEDCFAAAKKCITTQAAKIKKKR